MIKPVKLIHRSEGGSLIRSDALLEYKEGRIYFLKSAFALKGEIKSMAGAKWHQYDAVPRKIWSVADCPHNRFQLGFLMGEDVYAWFDRPIQHFKYADKYFQEGRKLLQHQIDAADNYLTYHYGVLAGEPGVGKTLVAQLVIEMSGIKDWLWLGPKSSLPNIQREFRLWDIDPAINVKMLNYEALVPLMEKGLDAIPQGLICDESTKCKGATSQRSKAVQSLADQIREKYGFDGYAIEMSGTPSPKSPIDWYSQCEIAWPGFLKEGSPKALEERLAFLVNEQYEAGVFKKRLGWKDDARKCKHCGQRPEEHGSEYPEDHEYHTYEPSINEVEYLYERLKGLVLVKRQKDCLDLPEKHYRTVECKPTASVLRVADAILEAAPNVITGVTMLRELSDGFQYRETPDGKTSCPHCNGTKVIDEWFSQDDRCYQSVDMLNPDLVASLQKRQIPCPNCNGTGEIDKTKRITKEIPCPKDAALRDLLDECEENTGRILIFTGFIGSLDRCVNLCHKAGWDVVRCDGRGWEVTKADGTLVLDKEPLDYWAATTDNPRVAFVANAESGGMSFTLTESRMAVFYSNSFKPEYRFQAEERIHRLGMDNRGCTIVDLVHLPSDKRVIDVLKENRHLELMSMGEFINSAT
jgi:hypothetical protein